MLDDMLMSLVYNTSIPSTPSDVNRKSLKTIDNNGDRGKNKAKQ